MFAFRHIWTVFLLLVNFSLSAQLLNPAPGWVYEDSIISRVDITIPTDTLNWILHPDNVWSDTHFRATFVYDNGVERDTIEEVGFRLKGNTSRTAGKKSYKVSKLVTSMGYI